MQHITVITLLYVYSIILPTNSVNAPPLIEIMILIIDIGSCVAAINPCEWNNAAEN